MSEAAKILELVQSIVEETTGERPDIQVDSPLISSGILDSLSMMRLYTELETELDVHIDVEELTEETFETVNAIAELIESIRNQAG